MKKQFNPSESHRVEPTFDDGVHAKLICPEKGCQPPEFCTECGRSIEDAETKPCYYCPEASDGCWVKGWFDNLPADELLSGKITVAIEPHWDGNAMTAHISEAA